VATGQVGVGRRAVLGAGVAAAAAVALGGLPSRARAAVRTTPRLTADVRQRVVVVGAGLAGLSCALTLVDHGWDVDLLEARERVGGRAHTLRDPFGPGTHVDLGGELVDRDHHLLLRLVDRFGLSTEVRDKSQRLALFWDRRRADYSARVDRPHGDLHRDIQLVADASARLAERVDAEHPERSRHAERLDTTSAAHWADGLGMSPLGRRVWEAGWIVSDYGTAAADMSLLFYAQQENFGSSSDAVVEALRIRGGSQRLAEAIAAYLAGQGSVRLRLGEPVVSVRVRPGLATVRTDGGTYQGAHVVVAAPPPTLRRISFDPALPPALRDVIDSRVLDAITKVVVPYRGHPWRTAGWTGESLADLTYRYSWDATDSRPDAPDGALVAFTGGGRPGRRLTALSPSRRVDLVEAELRRVFPEVAGHEDPRHPAVTVAWADEPFTGGGYANYRPGQMLEGKPAFRTAYGPLRFAGEHTEAMGQYLQSALLSGRRVAREIGPAPR
jgi:monoamine oxidase